MRASFNRQHGGDFHDWYSDTSNVAKTFGLAAQDAFGFSGGSTDNGTAELTALDVIMFTPKTAITSTPAPSSTLVLLLGAIPGALMLRRRKNQK